MIDPKSLRIGSLVNWGDLVVTIRGIHTQSVLGKDKDKVHFYVDGIGKMHYHCVYPEEISPIQLSEEWLIRGGFELEYKSEFIEKYFFPTNDRYTIYLYPDKCFKFNG